MREAGATATIGEVRRQATNQLRGAFGGDPRSAVAGLDVRLLVAHVLRCEPGELITRDDKSVPANIAQAIGELVARRASGTPVARLTGHKEFYGLDLFVSKETLVPRPDTESVVDAVLALVKSRGWHGRPLRVLDLGTGAGGLLLALLSELAGATGIGADISADALATAGRNAKRHGLETRARFVASDWASAIEEKFDLVVSNPPYIRTGDLAGLDDEVRLHDPAAALDGGTDGLDAYRVILGDLRRLLVPGGAAFLEIGHDQASSVRAVAEREGFKVTLMKDLAGLDRVIGLSLV